MVSTVFNFLCSLFIVFCLVEIAAVLFVSVHEIFTEKRKQLLAYYRRRKK
ncbi:MAG: hypothetical protein ACI4RC_05225 [Oscillospiraceae bacterium]